MKFLKSFCVVAGLFCFFFELPAQSGTAGKSGLVSVPLPGNPSRPVTYNTSVVIADQFESFDVPKGVHPRVYFRAEDMAGLKAKATTTGVLSSAYYDSLVSLANNANHLTNSKLPIPSAVNGNNFNATILESAASRALLYRLDPVANKEKGREAITMAKNCLLTWRNGVDGSEYGRGNQAARTLHDFSLVYDWCYDLMTPAERRELLGEIKIKDPSKGIHIGNNTKDPNNQSTGLMKALTMLEFSTTGKPNNIYHGWENHFRPTNFGAHNGHHLEASIPAITAFAIAVFDEYPYVWEIVSTWLFDNVFPTSNFLLEAGMPWQGASYGTARLAPLSRANVLVYQMQTPTHRKSCFTPNIVDAAHSYFYYRRPDGQYVRMGDTFVTSLPFGVPHQQQEQEMMLCINQIFKDPYLQKELTFLRKHKQFSPVLGFILWDNEIQPVESYIALPTAFYSPFPNGEMMHHTKWVNEIDFNANTMHLNMKIGALRTWNHEHMDAGTFQIYYKGGLAVDAGSYEGNDIGQGSGFGSEPESGWDRSTNSHNTILIRDPHMDKKTAETSNPREQHFSYRGRPLANGGGQHFIWDGGRPSPKNLYRQNGVPSYFMGKDEGYTAPIQGGKLVPPTGPIVGNIPTSKIISHEIPRGLKPSYTYLKGDMAELYGYRAEEAKRSFVSLDFNNDTYPGALIVFDRITSGNKWGDGANYEKYWMLHSINEPTVIRDKDGRIDAFLIKRTEEVAPGLKYNGQLLATPLLPAKDNLNYELVKGHDVFGQPYRVGRGRMITEEAGEFMILTSPKGKKLTDLMLNVMQVSDAGTAPLPVACIGKETDVMVGAKIHDCVVLFSTSGKLIDSLFTIPAAGKEEALKYHIADLTGGAWTVINDKGLKIIEFNVETKGNIGTFTASASSAYTLVPTEALAAAQRQTSPRKYNNPVIPRSVPDPTLIRIADGSFYLYGTEDIRNTPIFHSKDLVNWTFVGTAFTNRTRPTFEPRGGLWAPEINYINGKYILYYSMSVWGGEMTSGIGRAVADRPEGPFTDLGMLFRSNTIGVQNSIDQNLVQDGGKKYLFWGSFSGLFGIEMTDDGLNVKEGAEKRQVAGKAYEGINIHKRGKYYYLFASIGSCCRGLESSYTLVVGRSKNLWGPYTDKKGRSMMDNCHEIVLSKNEAFVGVGHCSQVVQDDDGNDWLFYHGVSVDHPYGRKLLMDRIVWVKDWPTFAGGTPSLEADAPVFK